MKHKASKMCKPINSNLTFEASKGMKPGASIKNNSVGKRSIEHSGKKF